MRWAVLGLVGLSPGRAEIDADWHRKRLYDIEQTRAKLRSTYAEYDPPMRRLLDYAGLDPDHALLRWGNFDRTLYPAVHGVRARRHGPLVPVPAQHPVDLGAEPEAQGRHPGLLSRSRRPGARRSDGRDRCGRRRDVGPDDQLVGPARARARHRRRRSAASSWATRTCRACSSPTTDPRGVPEAPARRRLGGRVEVLNTGHLGYSPEQEYYTLVRVRRPAQAPVRRPQPLRQRLRRPLRGPRKARATGRREVLAGRDRPVLPDPPAHLAGGPRPVGQPGARGEESRDSTRAGSRTS